MSSTSANRHGLAALVWPRLRPRLGGLALALALGLVIAALAAVQPLLTRTIVDDGLIGRHYDKLLLASGGMLLIALTGMLLGGLHRLLYVRLSGRVLFALREEAYAHLLSVSPRRLADWPVGDLVTRLDGDVAEVQRFGTDSLATAISGLLGVAAAAAVMLTLSWRLTLMVAALVPLQLLIRQLARPRIESSTRALREQAGRIGGFLVETLTGARAVQGAAAELSERGRLAALNEVYLGRVLSQQLIGYGTGSAAALVGHLATAGAFVAGGWYVLHGELTAGTLIAFVAYLGRSSGSAASLLGLYTGYQRARVSLVRLQQLLELPTVGCPADAEPIAALARGALLLEHVTLLEPRSGRRLLDAVDLEIPAGSKLLLAGASGAGKSTLADLLRRFVEPDAGRVLLDGRPLDRYRLLDLRRRIVVVEHAPTLFRGTILDNLRYGHPEANEAAVLEAALRAGVEEFVAELPAGYLTPVGEDGAGLSTGQRQRIAIARASLADPLIVILDEATSGLDLAAARALHQAVDDSFPQRTRIVITHHPTPVGAPSLSLVLEDGRLRRLGAQA